MKRNNAILGFSLAAPILLLAPLVGVLCLGRSLVPYLEFPPLTRYVRHADFSWTYFTLMALGDVMVIGVFLTRALFAPQNDVGNRRGAAFPIWGYAGLALGLASWTLAWTRFDFFAPWQRFTFSPLWFSYIIVVNALTFWRTGRCMMLDRPRYFGWLFVFSAVFWWFFEYLNRFVQNWYYVGLGEMSAFEYFIYATLPFSTVLPAVLGTCELLESFPRWSEGLTDFLPIDTSRSNAFASMALLIASLGLVGIGAWPNWLYPLLWVSPLLILCSIQALLGQPTVFSPVRRGDWRRICLLALAALICGFFWEMWNVHSLAKWRYSVPFVNAFHIFEMPLLGYAGYIPFGLECGVVGDMVAEFIGDSNASDPVNKTN